MINEIDLIQIKPELHRLCLANKKIQYLELCNSYSYAILYNIYNTYNVLLYRYLNVVLTCRFTKT